MTQAKFLLIVLLFLLIYLLHGVNGHEPFSHDSVPWGQGD